MKKRRLGHEKETKGGERMSLNLYEIGWTGIVDLDIGFIAFHILEIIIIFWLVFEIKNLKQKVARE